jgi:Uma2 family endonuclease
VANVKPKHLEGPPDLAIEVVSPESVARDRQQKFAEYQAAGVREYWIVDPMAQTIELFALQGGGFVAVPERDGKLSSTVVAGWYVRPAWLWQKPRTSALAALAELSVRA